MDGDGVTGVIGVLGESVHVVHNFLFVVDMVGAYDV
jgi:hypothetical protein